MGLLSWLSGKRDKSKSPAFKNGPTREEKRKREDSAMLNRQTQVSTKQYRSIHDKAQSSAAASRRGSAKPKLGAKVASVARSTGSSPVKAMSKPAPAMAEPKKQKAPKAEVNPAAQALKTLGGPGGLSADNAVMRLLAKRALGNMRSKRK